MRSFHAIELTSRCNLRCKYCPQPAMLRAKQDMDDRTFERVLYWLREFGQRIVHLHNFGESTLHPKLIEYVDAVTDLVPDVRLSTNGVGVSRETVVGLRDAGLTALSISVHRPEAAMETVKLCQEIGLPYDVADGPMKGAHDWAGQTQNPTTLAGRFRCDFLGDEKAVVLADGRVAACCIDVEGKSAQISVWEDLRAYSFRPFDLCLNCHHAVPEEKFPNWREELAYPAYLARPALEGVS